MPMIDMSVEELFQYRGCTPCPKDFDEYWARALREMNDTNPQTELIPADFQTDCADCFDLFFTGVKGARIHAKLLIPKNVSQPCPALLQFHGYTSYSGNWNDNAVQHLLWQRSEKHVQHTVNTSPLGGRFICGKCGAGFRRKQNKGNAVFSCMSHVKDLSSCDMPPIPEDAVMQAFLRLYDNLKHGEILQFVQKTLSTIRSRKMLWSTDIVELNQKISDISSQSHKLSTLNRRGMVDPDIFISKSNQLAEQLRNAKQQKERILQQEDRSILDSTEQLLETIEAGPEVLEAFDEELFCELIDKIIVESNVKIRFRLKNGLELPETMERTVR